MKNLLFYFALLLISLNHNCFSQEDGAAASSNGPIEVFLIDSYITPEAPHKFILTFYTSDSCTSILRLANRYKYVVSSKLAEEHKAEIDISTLRFDSTDIPFVIYVTGKDGTLDSSEQYDVAMPSGISQEAGGASSNLFLMCCLGGTVFLLPSPTFVAMGETRYFSLTKEIPILSLQTTSYKYPIGYFAVEYSYIFDAPQRNYIRLGYKHVFELPYIEYFSPGINWFTNLEGTNGVSPELSIGFFKIYDLFTFYTRYRYNYVPGVTGGDFHEISIGLYSGFFTFHFTL